MMSSDLGRLIRLGEELARQCNSMLSERLTILTAYCTCVKAPRCDVPPINSL
jgi:hypothetical protein